MKLLRGRIDWLPGNSERPYLYLLVDKIPGIEDMRFAKYDNFYCAEQGGFCRLIATGNPFRRRDGTQDPGMLLHMMDGRLHAVWPSGSMHNVESGRVAWWMDQTGLGACMEARLTRNEDVYNTGWTFSVGSVLVSWVRGYADKIEIGEGFTWPPNSKSAVGVVFPTGSSLAFACRLRRSNRLNQLCLIPETLPDGASVEDVRAALQAAVSAGNPAVAREIASRYTRYVGPNSMDTLLDLLAYEPAVKLPDGSFWTKPTSR